MEEGDLVDFKAAKQVDCRLHLLPAVRLCEVNRTTAVGVGEISERGSDLDNLAEPVGVRGVGEDGLEEGLFVQRRCLDKGQQVL